MLGKKAMLHNMIGQMCMIKLYCLLNSWKFLLKLVEIALLRMIYDLNDPTTEFNAFRCNEIDSIRTISGEVVINFVGQSTSPRTDFIVEARTLLRSNYSDSQHEIENFKELSCNNLKVRNYLLE